MKILEIQNQKEMARKMVATILVALLLANFYSVSTIEKTAGSLQSSVKIVTHKPAFVVGY